MTRRSYLQGVVLELVAHFIILNLFFKLFVAFLINKKSTSGGGLGLIIFFKSIVAFLHNNKSTNGGFGSPPQASMYKKSTSGGLGLNLFL